MKYYTFQIRYIKRLLKGLSTLIWVKPGHGKTLIILKWVAKRKKRGDKPKLLLIAPPLLAEEEWKDATKQYPNLRNVRIIFMHGDYWGMSLKLLKRSKFDICVITPEGLTRLIRDARRCFNCFDSCAIDEITKFKNPKGVRFSNLQRIKNSYKNIKTWVGLTGTAMPKDYRDLFTQGYLIGGKKTFGTHDYSAFEKRYFYFEQYNPYTPQLFPGAKKRIEKRLRSFTVSPREDEYREMPEIVEYQYGFHLPPKAKKLHDQMWKKKAITIGKHDVLAANKGVATFKCAQIASGSVYKFIDPLNPYEGTEDIPIHNRKNDILEEILNEYAGNNILILYNYLSELARIHRLVGAVPDLAKSKNCIRDWKRGILETATGHPASMAHGLNLQSGGRIILWYSVPPNAEYWVQAIKRLHRGNITEPVYSLYITALGTVDIRFQRIVNKRKEKQDVLMQRFSDI